MKLAALGLVTVGIGLVLGVPGLSGIGLFWVGMGFPVRAHGRKLQALRATSSDGTPEPGARAPTPGVDGRSFALGTLLWMVLGVPSLVVGLLEIGISAEHQEWRWLPLIVGGFALGIGVIGAVLYLLGSAVLAVGSGGRTPDVGAVVWIQAMRETGTYVNERPRLEFDFRVEPDPVTGAASYEVTKKATVPATAMAGLRVGSGFRALVAGSEAPTAMEIQWDQPVSGDDPTRPAPDVSDRLDRLEVLYRDGKVTQTEYETQRQRILGSL
jgi:hypothetical protein